MNYTPAPPPTDPRELPEYIYRELKRAGNALKDNSPVVLYRANSGDIGPLSAGIFLAGTQTLIPPRGGNIIRISASVTFTMTGIADDTPLRERTIINVGTAAIVLLSDNATSTASYRLALVGTLQLSANASVTLWYDPQSARHRAIGRT